MTTWNRPGCLWSEQCAPHLQPQRVLSALRATCPSRQLPCWALLRLLCNRLYNTRK